MPVLRTLTPMWQAVSSGVLAVLSLLGLCWPLLHQEVGTAFGRDLAWRVDRSGVVRVDLQVALPDRPAWAPGVPEPDGVCGLRRAVSSGCCPPRPARTDSTSPRTELFTAYVRYAVAFGAADLWAAKYRVDFEWLEFFQRRWRHLVSRVPHRTGDNRSSGNGKWVCR